MNYLLYVVRRLLLLIPLLIGVTFVVFVLTNLVISLIMNTINKNVQVK